MTRFVGSFVRVAADWSPPVPPNFIGLAGSPILVQQSPALLARSKPSAGIILLVESRPIVCVALALRVQSRVQTSSSHAPVGPGYRSTRRPPFHIP